uniref:Uncharacterized protein n=1 Tax=Alexandrium monilatum TaxID=311494 RepID=A0A7S4SMA2_9DINO
MPPRARRRVGGMAARGLSMGALLAVACGQPSRRLRIANGCGSEPLWIVRRPQDAASPGPQVLRLEPMEHHDFSTPSGPGAALYWPRAGCDERGRRCAIGTAADEAPAGANGTADRAPPVDSRLEAVFGDASLPCDPASGRTSGCDRVDVSLAGGYTLPFTFLRRGPCAERADGEAESDTLDCSQLSLARCPDAEADLRAVNPRTRQVSGCSAPRRRLLDERGSGTQAQESTYWGAVRRACRGRRRPSRGGSLPATCHASARYELTFLCPPPARDAAPPTQAASAVAARRATSEDQRATAPAGVPLVGDLGGAVQLAAEEEACDAVCTYRGKPASCKFRVGWALQHRFQGDGGACPAALRMVQSQCGVCSRCSLAALGCGAPDGASGGEFDCMRELFNWQKAWTSAKKDWCCRHRERGCRNAAAPAAERRCDGASEGWSGAHRAFCCRHSGAGCLPGTPERPPQPGGANLRAAAPAPQPSPQPLAASRSSVPRTSAEALQRIIVGLFTGPVVALAASVVGSFLGLALCRECRELTSDRQQDSYPMIAGGNSQGGTPGSGSPMPGSPNGTPAFRANSALGTYGEMDMGAFASHVAAPPLNRAVSVPPAGRTTVPSISRAASGPPTSRAASAPGA